eukprot:TRINITY_DN9801_c0_g2_i5.p2 TRINITY_DN9801_c0_g2~~TRINITY_DN9801_c0_g2_i5.p2  ORF type:complete len:237 (-),score=90.42 TRINITY_DN9801_c0_g2_i5:166-876(-)
MCIRDRILLDRIEDSKTGVVNDAFQVKIPANREKEVVDAAKLLGEKVYDHYPYIEGGKPMGATAEELAINRTWKASLAITGAEGLPLIKDAGNVLRPETALRISMRIPPTFDTEKGEKALREILTKDPPYGAQVEILKMIKGPGLNCADMTPEFSKIVADASKTFYGKEPIYYGEGGSIPFLSSLAQQFPKAQFVITGVLGPESNAHGPNEMLEIPYTKKMICSLVYMIASYHETK